MICDRKDNHDFKILSTYKEVDWTGHIVKWCTVCGTILFQTQNDGRGVKQSQVKPSWLEVTRGDDLDIPEIVG